MIQVPPNTGLLLFPSLDPDSREGRGHGQTVEGLNRNAPLGLFYLAAIAQRAGVSCDVIDQRIEPFDADELAQIVATQRPPWLGFYLCDYEVPRGKVIRMIRAVRAKSDAPIICGGPPYDPRPLLEAGANAVALGEGERTFESWLAGVAGGLRVEQIPGVAYLRDGEVRRTAPAPLVANLDELPFPIRKYPGRYVITGNPMIRMPCYELVTNRGCVLHCAFCSSHRFWGRFRVRSVDNVIDETMMLRERYGARYLHFRDDIFAPSRAWLDEWVAKHTTIGTRLPYSIYLHPDSHRRDVEYAIGALARSGCNMICYGLQSVDPDVLRAIDRDPDEPARLAEHLAACKKYGVMSLVSVIFGLPRDDGAATEATGAWLRKHRPTIMLALPLQKLYGSPIAERYPGDTPVGKFSAAQLDELIHRITRRYYLTGWHLPRLAWQVLWRNPRWFLYVLPRLRHGLDYFQFTRRRKNW
jgi:anaerobic magnesium-protoporphyrin IX monomethyl ester cyclase